MFLLFQYLAMQYAKQFLEDIRYHQLDMFPGVFFIERPGRPDSSYVISTYERLKRQRAKKEFFAFLGQFGQDENRAKWDLHHIVERQHLEPFYGPAALAHNYQSVWPVVLVFGTEEHWAYNQTLHNRESEIIYGLQANAGNTREKRALLRRTEEMYRNTYRGNPVLRSIAANVLSKVRIR